MQILGGLAVPLKAQHWELMEILAFKSQAPCFRRIPCLKPRSLSLPLKPEPRSSSCGRINVVSWSQTKARQSSAALKPMLAPAGALGIGGWFTRGCQAQLFRPISAHRPISALIHSGERLAARSRPNAQTRTT
jgi:hypothetical protein